MKPIIFKQRGKTYRIITLAITVLIGLLIAAMFAKQCYFIHISESSGSTELDYENIPRFLISGGKDRYEELYDIGKRHIETELKAKYKDANYVYVKDTHVLVDVLVAPSTEDGFPTFFDKRWAQYSGVVLTECEIDQKEFVAYVDLSTEEWYVYDTYQTNEIVDAIVAYFDNLIDTKPLFNTAYITELDVYLNKIGASYQDVYDLDGAVHNYFDGNVEKFLTNNDVLNNINLTVIYNSDKNLPISEEFIRNVGQENIGIYRISDKNIAYEYVESYDMEITDVWEHVDEVYLSRGRQERYGWQWLWEYQGYRWTPKTNN